MKYFKLQETPEFKYGPQIKDWYGTFDVRDIRMETFPKLPKRQVYAVEPLKTVIFTDIVLFPFLLISPMVKKVIEMYKEQSFFREIILLNQVSGESKIYYLPVLNETKELQLVEQDYLNGEPVNPGKSPDGTRFLVNRHIFWVRDSVKRHTVVSLDFAESLLRREAIGVGLKEVMLYGKQREG